MNKENLIKPKPTDFVVLNDIQFTHADIFNVVDLFYKQVAQDSMLKVPFASVKNWPEHIERLTHFWWARFGGQPYLDVSYNPIQKHFEAGFNKDFLDHWLGLFHTTLQQCLAADQCDLWKNISIRMGESLHFRNEMMNQRV